MSKENNLVAVDFETYYDAEYSLTKMSVRNYLRDSRFDAYLVSVYDGESIRYVGRPAGFDWSLLDGRTICAHNAAFDEQVYMRLIEIGVIKTPVSGCSWICTADLAAWLGVKRNLADAAKHLLGRELSKAVRSAMKGRASADCLSDSAVLEYGDRDAVTCYDLAARYLGDWPEKEREISRLNREAGYRGVSVDPAKIMEGVRILSPKLAEAESKLPWVAAGEKPLSPNAIKDHAASLGIPVPSSFAKDSEEFLAWLEEYGPRYAWAGAVGEYRSINTLLNRVKSLRDGRDPLTNRFPYGIKYYGAFTGRFCLPGSAEVLTPSGWRELQHWRGTPIVQWDPSGVMQMLPATANVFSGGGTQLGFTVGGGTVFVTPEHKIPRFTGRKHFYCGTAEEYFGRRIDIPVSGELATPQSLGLSPEEARLLVAVQADGCLYTSKNDNVWLFGFRKERKYDRLVSLLGALSIQYRSRADREKGRYSVAIRVTDAPWYLSKRFSLGLLLSSSSETREAFMQELVYWDGCHDCGGSVSYTSVVRENADVVATIAHLTNRHATVSERKRNTPAWSASYRVHIRRKRECRTVRVTGWTKRTTSRSVYCPTTVTGFFLCRYNGIIFVSGNSGGGEGGGKFNCQNMPRKAMFGVDVRPMFRAAPGKTLLIADYNQVEARYLLWRVGDTEALAPCFQGKSVYQAYAERTDLCGPDTDLKETNDALYKLTKARVLGLGYQSGGPKFRAFAATNYKVFLTEEQAQASVDEFRERNPRIVRFWAEHHAALAYSARRRDETHQVELKSGRILTYYEPRSAGREMQAYQFRGEAKAYLYGGKLTENEVQASCRDILCEAWLACAKAGYFPVLNVHDELVFEIDKGTEERAEADIRRLMTTCSPWADGLPLGVDIILSDVYSK